MTTPRICIRHVAPVSTRRGCAFVTRESGCGVEERDFHVYPESERGERLRRERVAAGLYLGEAARRLGLSASELSGLERGRYDTDEAGWAACFAAIERYRGKKGSCEP